MSDDNGFTPEAVPFSFRDLDLLNAPDDPFQAPIGTWPGRLTEINVYPGKKDPDSRWIKFVWVHREGLGRWDDLMQLPDGRDPAVDVQRRSRVKQRLLWLEVPEEQMDELKVEDLVGTTAIITTRKNGNFTNAVKIEPEYVTDGGEAAAPVSDNYDYMAVFAQQGTETT